MRQFDKQCKTQEKAVTARFYFNILLLKKSKQYYSDWYWLLTGQYLESLRRKAPGHNCKESSGLGSTDVQTCE